MHTGINTGLVLTGNVNREDGTHGLTGLDLNIPLHQLEDWINEAGSGYYLDMDLQPLSRQKGKHLSLTSCN